MNITSWIVSDKSVMHDPVRKTHIELEEATQN